MANEPIIKKVEGGVVWSDDPRKVYPDASMALEDRRPPRMAPKKTAPVAEAPKGK